ncbi:hypothetical protein [Streptomyces sp. SM11]|uniref:hypothetical protein n=1 Tax=Streptomyces sp. SM11 TaxID=565557 RepID=UPI000CD4E7A2|nr:hypothetical protein [Streptomyces sp. SM11]
MLFPVACLVVQMKRRRTDRKAGKVTIATVCAVTSRHELPGVEGTYSEVTIAMEERIVGYLQGVWEKEVVGAGLWTPSFPTPLPDEPAQPTTPLASGLPTLEY